MDGDLIMKVYMEVSGFKGLLEGDSSPKPVDDRSLRGIMGCEKSEKAFIERLLRITNKEGRVELGRGKVLRITEVQYTKIGQDPEDRQGLFYPLDRLDMPFGKYYERGRKNRISLGIEVLSD